MSRVTILAMKNRIVILFVLFLFQAGCGAEIGDECGYDYDCSQNMDRDCDPNQPSGYCLIAGCTDNECPKEAVCVEFIAQCPLKENGEPIDDCNLIEPSRTRTFCLRHCSSNGDCRSKYSCVDVSELEASVIDSNTHKSKVCVPKLDDV